MRCLAGVSPRRPRHWRSARLRPSPLATPAGKPPPAKRRPRQTAPAKAEPTRRSRPPLAALSASSRAKELGASGQVDPIAGLGIRNPVCDRPAQIRDRATRLSCEANGTPESNYPASNYGFDVFIDTGHRPPESGPSPRPS